MSLVIPMHLAVEDALSEHAAKKVISRCRPECVVGSTYRRGGSGYLKRSMKGFNNAARITPFLVLADLDTVDCAPELLRRWLGVPKHDNLLFRVAVREIESWLLADQQAFAAFLGVKSAIIPTAPDSLRDPKAKLVDLARSSPRRTLRRAIVPAQGTTAVQGPAYNSALESFVREQWEPERASAHSDSLARAIAELRRFVPSWVRE